MFTTTKKEGSEYWAQILPQLDAREVANHSSMNRVLHNIRVTNH